MPFADSPCQHRFRTVARNISACVTFRNKVLEFTSGEAPTKWAKVKHCSNPVCERIFEAVPAGSKYPTIVRG